MTDPNLECNTNTSGGLLFKKKIPLNKFHYFLKLQIRGVDTILRRQ